MALRSDFTLHVDIFILRSFIVLSIFNNCHCKYKQLSTVATVVLYPKPARSAILSATRIIGFAIVRSESRSIFGGYEINPDKVNNLQQLHSIALERKSTLYCRLVSFEIRPILRVITSKFPLGDVSLISSNTISVSSKYYQQINLWHRTDSQRSWSPRTSMEGLE